MNQPENSGLGSHLLADLYGVDAVLLQNETALLVQLGSALDAAGFNILQRTSYQFSSGGEGVTGMFLLSESHLTFHTYPEHGYIALDLFSCGSAKPELVVARVLADFSPKRSEISVHRRGERLKRADLDSLRSPTPEQNIQIVA